MPYTEVAGDRVPIRMWADPDQVEAQAMDQLRNVTRVPWVHGLAVMPDVHFGKGATVGSVIAMRDAVSPAAVGVDIGCGMTAVRTDLTASRLPDDLRGLRHALEAAIPVGFHAHDEPVDPARVPGLRSRRWDTFWQGFDDLAEAVHPRRERALRQMGTLGGGNHFLEVCLDDEQTVWLVLHSGSRNIGKELADHHIGRAKDLPHNQDLPDRDLAVFLSGTPEMDAYRRDLFWAQDYARRNRDVMMGLACAAVAERIPGTGFTQWISCHHNYVAEETYDGVDVLVTRKGAIRAGRGEWGIIPGSMATGTYIVKGLGNPASFNSASHGAGRRMSRSKARKTFTKADLEQQTRGVECRKDLGVVDEIPGAYKDLESVIDAQTDLVEVAAHLRQVICVKG
ncbi:tRNA-splicing ligase RtcB [Nocardiopsis sp. Huas11]|uniref:RtcB family protein n=1 Tax=Nocardiopsis sp. Huas11 TaxID=2183912 RepID=UPI000EAC62BC|nr:RtcB family protein [Nocardiopsis sp. Huas11]RKS09606.1 tRNA-splicing ligase RtcB [Nocardiopsis sp. Huas11]